MIERHIIKYSVNWPIKYRKWVDSKQPHNEILSYGGELISVEESEPNIWFAEMLIDTDHPDSDNIALMGSRKGYIMTLLKPPKVSFLDVVVDRENKEILAKVKKMLKKGKKELTIT